MDFFVCFCFLPPTPSIDENLKAIGSALALVKQIGLALQRSSVAFVGMI